MGCVERVWLCTFGEMQVVSHSGQQGLLYKGHEVGHHLLTNTKGKSQEYLCKDATIGLPRR